MKLTKQTRTSSSKVLPRRRLPTLTKRYDFTAGTAALEYRPCLIDTGLSMMPNKWVVIARPTLDPPGAEFISECIKISCIICHISMLRCQRYLKSFHIEDKGLFILYSQYHCCWCPGDVRSQGISSPDIDLVILEYIIRSPRRINNSKLFILYISSR